MKIIIGITLIVSAVLLGLWLSIYVMLYGGIMQAVENWGVDNSAVVWGIIRAFFFSFGIMPAYVVGLIGFAICNIDFDEE